MNENIQALFEMGKIAPTEESALKFCRTSKIGEHKCCVKTRYGWCCDLCLEEELLRLYSSGIHTVNSCCGHGNFGLASILVAGEESAARMEALGYEKATPHDYGNRLTSWAPKSELIYCKKRKEADAEE